MATQANLTKNTSTNATHAAQKASNSTKNVSTKANVSKNVTQAKKSNVSTKAQVQANVSKNVSANHSTVKNATSNSTVNKTAPAVAAQKRNAAPRGLRGRNNSLGRFRPPQVFWHALRFFG